MASKHTSKRPAGRRPVRLEVLAAEAHEVFVSGDFTEWSEGQLRLTRDAEGVWSATLELSPGEYQYRLKIDGEWRDDPRAKKRVPNAFGSENCVLIVP
jgi:1,4-alpha-glucan branching enzyme